MSLTTLSDEIEMLRVQLETALPMPFVVVVSSAREGDGKGIVAAGLASNLEAAGYSTLLVLADEQKRDVDATREPKSLKDITEFGIAPYLVRHASTALRVMVLPSRKIRNTISREAVESFTQICRKTYQVTIIEAAVMMTNSFAMLAAAAASGVLLTVREGRRVRGEDRELAARIERDRLPLLGVVCVAEPVISGASTAGAFFAPQRTKVPTVTVDVGPGREEQAV